MDYPGRESAVPEWLAQQISCNNYTDYGGCSRIILNSLLQSTLIDFIAEFGRFGRWQSWLYTDRSSGILGVAHVSINMVSFKWVSTRGHCGFWWYLIKRRSCYVPHPRRTAAWIGFHDDSFAYAIGHGWFFYPVSLQELRIAGRSCRLVAESATSKWPVGGIMYTRTVRIFSVCSWYSRVMQIANPGFYELWGRATRRCSIGFVVDGLRVQRSPRCTHCIEPGPSADLRIDVEISNTGAPFACRWIWVTVSMIRVLLMIFRICYRTTRNLSVVMSGVSPDVLNRTRLVFELAHSLDDQIRICGWTSGRNDQRTGSTRSRNDSNERAVFTRYVWCLPHIAAFWLQFKPSILLFFLHVFFVDV